MTGSLNSEVTGKGKTLEPALCPGLLFTPQLLTEPQSLATAWVWSRSRKQSLYVRISSKSPTFSPWLFKSEFSSDRQSLFCHGETLIRMLRGKSKIRVCGWCLSFQACRNKTEQNICVAIVMRKAGRKCTDKLIILITGSRVMSDIIIIAVVIIITIAAFFQQVTRP